MESLVLSTPPPLDPDWLAYQKTIPPPSPKAQDTPSSLARQESYARERRALHADLLARPENAVLLEGVLVREHTVRSSRDDSAIPILEYSRGVLAGEGNDESTNIALDVVLVYYHGGGLRIGDADSEELSCRQALVALNGSCAVYSVGYRLMPEYSASICLSDSIDALVTILSRLRDSTPPGGQTPKVILMGSSSGGQLAALVSQHATAPDFPFRDSIAGVLLRCPVTSDVFSGPEYIPESLRHYHTSASEPFLTPLAGFMRRAVPRDGLALMPLEAPADVFSRLPRTWIQLCTNDVLYSDGLCYGIALEKAGVEVRADIVEGWPHTFWLPAPHLPRAVQADRAMIDGLKWLLS